jgi:hypothetical protein
MPTVRDKVAVTGNGHVNQGQPGGAETHREIGDRESRRHVHSDIENTETPMEV